MVFSRKPTCASSSHVEKLYPINRDFSRTHNYQREQVARDSFHMAVITSGTKFIGATMYLV